MFGNLQYKQRSKPHKEAKKPDSARELDGFVPFDSFEEGLNVGVRLDDLIAEELCNE